MPKKDYRPRISIDMKPEDAKYISDVLPYGEKMSILRLVIEDFIAEIKANPSVLEGILLRTLTSITKVPLRRGLVTDLLAQLQIMYGALDDETIPEKVGIMAKELEDALR